MCSVLLTNMTSVDALERILISLSYVATVIEWALHAMLSTSDDNTSVVSNIGDCFNGCHNSANSHLKPIAFNIHSHSFA